MNTPFRKIWLLATNHIHPLLALGLLLSLAGCANVTHQASTDFDALRTAGKYTEAIQYAQSSIAQSCKDGNAPTCNEHRRVMLERIGDVYQQNLNNYAEAEKTYTELLGLYPQDEATLQASSGGDARKRLQQAYFKLAAAQTSLGKTSEALSNTRRSYYLYPDEMNRDIETVYLSRLAASNDPKNKEEAKKIRTFKRLWDDTWEAKWYNAGVDCPSKNSVVEVEKLAYDACRTDAQAKWNQDFLRELDSKLRQHNYRDYYTYATNFLLGSADEKRGQIKAKNDRQTALGVVAAVATVAVAYNVVRAANAQAQQDALRAQQQQQAAIAQQQQQVAAAQQQQWQAQQQAQQQAQLEQQQRFQEQQRQAQEQQRQQAQDYERQQGEQNAVATHCLVLDQTRSLYEHSYNPLLTNRCNQDIWYVYCHISPVYQDRTPVLNDICECGKGVCGGLLKAGSSYTTHYAAQQVAMGACAHPYKYEEGNGKTRWNPATRRLDFDCKRM